MTTCRFCPAVTVNPLCHFHATSWARLEAKLCIDCGVPAIIGAYCGRCRASRKWHSMHSDPIVAAYRLARQRRYKAAWQRDKRRRAA